MHCVYHLAALRRYTLLPFPPPSHPQHPLHPLRPFSLYSPHHRHHHLHGALAPGSQLSHLSIPASKTQHAGQVSQSIDIS
ncbi:hypothetical protein I7I53_08363 [Histoplasma capsulatum var. duboisii H88]|uniref:Uncharacterized protein n=1 Tax=Ajellomyces capsulatus (strain H88) TaxID=544711 RepID=A0A8A1LJ47_AJEC8|nr:hypothetical protein I7I53_08363 [Histoplasma capsulatum var. duboisii H88]